MFEVLTFEVLKQVSRRYLKDLDCVFVHAHRDCYFPYNTKWVSDAEPLFTTSKYLLSQIMDYTQLSLSLSSLEPGELSPLLPIPTRFSGK